MAMQNAIAIAKKIADACLDAEKLPEALFYCGFPGAVGAAELIIRRAPDGTLLQHGVVLFCLYYVFLVIALMVGIFEIIAGFWVAEDLVGRRYAGKKILKYSIVPLVFLLAAHGAFMSAK